MDDENYSLSDSLKQNSREKMYTWLSETTNGEKSYGG